MVPLNNIVFGWTPIYFEGNEKAGQVTINEVGADYSWGAAGDHRSTVCTAQQWKDYPAELKIAMMFVQFNTMVVRDGIDPLIAHQEFLKIAEYRYFISPDMPGALSGEGDEWEKIASELPDSWK